MHGTWRDHSPQTKISRLNPDCTCIMYIHMQLKLDLMAPACYVTQFVPVIFSSF